MSSFYYESTSTDIFDSPAGMSLAMFPPYPPLNNHTADANESPGARSSDEAKNGAVGDPSSENMDAHPIMKSMEMWKANAAEQQKRFAEAEVVRRQRERAEYLKCYEKFREDSQKKAAESQAKAKEQTMNNGMNNAQAKAMHVAQTPISRSGSSTSRKRSRETISNNEVDVDPMSVNWREPLNCMQQVASGGMMPPAAKQRMMPQQQQPPWMNNGFMPSHHMNGYPPANGYAPNGYMMPMMPNGVVHDNRMMMPSCQPMSSSCSLEPSTSSSTMNAMPCVSSSPQVSGPSPCQTVASKGVSAGLQEQSSCAIASTSNGSSDGSPHMPHTAFSLNQDPPLSSPHTSPTDPNVPLGQPLSDVQLPIVDEQFPFDNLLQQTSGELCELGASIMDDYADFSNGTDSSSQQPAVLPTSSSVGAMSVSVMSPEVASSGFMTPYNACGPHSAQNFGGPQSVQSVHSAPHSNSHSHHIATPGPSSVGQQHQQQATPVQQGVPSVDNARPTSSMGQMGSVPSSSMPSAVTPTITPPMVPSMPYSSAVAPSMESTMMQQPGMGQPMVSPMSNGMTQMQQQMPMNMPMSSPQMGGPQQRAMSVAMPNGQYSGYTMQQMHEMQMMQHQQHQQQRAMMAQQSQMNMYGMAGGACSSDTMRYGMQEQQYQRMMMERQMMMRQQQAAAMMQQQSGMAMTPQQQQMYMMQRQQAMQQHAMRMQQQGMDPRMMMGGAAPMQMYPHATPQQQQTMPRW